MADTGRLDELQKKFDENPRRYFAPLANEFRKAGDAERAIELCRTYLPHLPGHMSGYIVYGQALFDANRGREAAAVFQEALRIDPENVIALRHLGDIARLEGERSLAIQWYEKVLDLDPKNEEISAYVTELTVAEADVITDVITPEPVPVPTPVVPAPAVFAPAEPPFVVEPPSVEPVPDDSAPPIGEASIENREAAFEPVAVQTYAPYEYAEPVTDIIAAEPSAETPIDDTDIVNAVVEASPVEFEPIDLRPHAPTPVAFEPDPFVVPESDPFPISTRTDWASPNDTMLQQTADALAFGSPDIPEPSVPFITETLANLYVAQGLFSEALVVYRQLAETRDDPALHDRIRDLEARIAPANAPAERQRPSVTVRDFFASIGARRVPDDPSDKAPNNASGTTQPGLTHLFSSARVDDADVRAAQSLADAYVGTPGTNASVRSYAQPF